jgi:hypothetical protein
MHPQFTAQIAADRQRELRADSAVYRLTRTSRANAPAARTPRSRRPFGRRVIAQPAHS